MQDACLTEAISKPYHRFFLHYCHNKPGMHASNTIRFHVDYQGNIYQGCWCVKTYNGKICSKQTTKGKSGFISEMNSNNFTLLADIFSTQIN